MRVTKEGLNTKLYEKVYSEQQTCIGSLENSTPENVMQYACELVIREDILLSFEENDLDTDQCKDLLRERKPLDKLFLAWKNHESNHMSEIINCIENFENDIISQRKQRIQCECR